MQSGAGAGADALVALNGDNVLDGGAGSNWLMGGAGHDTFFTDARGGQVVWDTLVNFHAGDGATLWGFDPSVGTWRWDGVSGAGGHQGATLRADVRGTGQTDASITFAGLSMGQAQGLQVSTGNRGWPELSAYPSLMRPGPTARGSAATGPLGARPTSGVDRTTRLLQADPSTLADTDRRFVEWLHALAPTLKANAALAGKSACPRPGQGGSSYTARGARVARRGGPILSAGGRAVDEHSEVFVGVDAAKLRHAVAVAGGGRQGEVRYMGKVGADTESVRRLAAKLEKRHGRGLHFCYEAGPAGYGLYRRLTRLGHRCTVVASSLIPRKLAETRSVCGWGDRVKTNRRDARAARAPVARRRADGGVGARRGARGGAGT